MPSFPSISNGQLANGMRTSYISQTAFNDDFFSYTTTQNPTTFVTTGALSAVDGATSGNCPAGRVLRDNGKRLYPSAHPGVSTYMVGVFDPVSFLSGYIDPNSPVFAVYNGNKPASLDTTQLAKGVNPNGGGADLAPTVYTRGNIETTNGDLLVDGGNANVYGSISANNGNITADSGNIVASAGNIIAAKQIRSGFSTDNNTYTFDNSGTVDYTIDIAANPTQNINISATTTAGAGTVTGCTLNFSSAGTAGDLIRLFVNNSGAKNLAFDSGGASIIVRNGTFTLSASSKSVLTYVSNGTLWYLTSVTTGL